MSAPTDSAASWLSLLLAADHSRLVDALDMVTRGEADAIHQVRVSCRRARSHLATFAAPMGASWADDVGKRLRKLGRTCSEARDLEVLREVTVDHPDVDPEVTALERAALLSATRGLGKPRTAKATGALRAAAEDARKLETGTAVDLLPDLVDKTWDEFASAARRLTGDSPDADWHTARVRAKHARYTAEAAAPVLGEECAALAEGAKQAQTILGAHQDLVMTAGILDGLGTVAAARLAQEQRARRANVRTEFLTCWQSLTGMEAAWRSANSRLSSSSRRAV
jgi:CHAD domain-containing protein